MDGLIARGTTLVICATLIACYPQPVREPSRSGIGSAAQVSSGKSTLVVDKIIMNRTPQSGTWLLCFIAKAGSAENTFNVPDKTYSGDGITIDMGTKLSPVAPGTTVTFSVSLDDDQADVCATNAEDKSADSFAAGDGAKAVQRDNFNYVVHYHME